jgi:uncharacterized protein
MIVPDVNVLVFAYDAKSPFHVSARDWWEHTLDEGMPVGLPWVTALGFIRIVTQRRLFVDPLSVHQAVAHVRSWLGMPNVRIIMPGQDHGDILFGLLERLGTAGNLTTDAHLAALAIEYKAEIVSADIDFARFPGLKWRRLE